MYDLTNTDEPGNRIASFSFKNIQVRTVDRDGQIWFVASDVAKALGYAETKDMTRFLDEDEADRHNVPVRSENGTLQTREVTIISESGLYHALLKSRKPEAKPFRKWVTAEVLPAIRRQGFYGQAPSTEALAEDMPAIDQGLVYSQPLCLLIQPQADVTCVMPDGRMKTFGWRDRNAHHHLVVGTPWALDHILEGHAPIPHYTLFGAPLWFDLLGRRVLMAVGDAHTPTREDLQPLPAARSLIIGREFETHALYENMGYSVARYLVPSKPDSGIYTLF